MVDTPTPQGLKPRHISWLTIVLAALAVITFIAISTPSARYPLPMGVGMMEYGEGYTTSVSETASGMPMMDDSVSYGSGSSQGMIAHKIRCRPSLAYQKQIPLPISILQSGCSHHRHARIFES